MGNCHDVPHHVAGQPGGCDVIAVVGGGAVHGVHVVVQCHDSSDAMRRSTKTFLLRHVTFKAWFTHVRYTLYIHLNILYSACTLHNTFLSYS